MVWCGVTLEQAAPGDIYPSYATDSQLLPGSGPDKPNLQYNPRQMQETQTTKRNKTKLILV